MVWPRSGARTRPRDSDVGHTPPLTASPRIRGSNTKVFHQIAGRRASSLTRFRISPRIPNHGRSPLVARNPRFEPAPPNEEPRVFVPRGALDIRLMPPAPGPVRHSTSGNPNNNQNGVASVGRCAQAVFAGAECSQTPISTCSTSRMVSDLTEGSSSLRFCISPRTLTHRCIAGPSKWDTTTGYRRANILPTTTPWFGLCCALDGRILPPGPIQICELGNKTLRVSGRLQLPVAAEAVTQPIYRRTFVGGATLRGIMIPSRGPYEVLQHHHKCCHTTGEGSKPKVHHRRGDGTQTI